MENLISPEFSSKTFQLLVVLMIIINSSKIVKFKDHYDIKDDQQKW